MSTSRRIANGRVVTVAYTLTDDQGNVLDERTPEEPLSYVHGEGQLLAAIERAIEGQTPGFRKSIQLDPLEAYGAYQPDLVVDVPRSSFGSSVEILVGMKFNTTGPDEKPLIVRVIEFDDETVTLDGNHPLAGITLNFDLRVIDVRDPSEEEKETGKVTAPRGRSDLH